MNRKISTVVGLIIVALLAWFGYVEWQSHRPNTSGSRQAIFLGDGQVYFGYASSLRNQVVTLVDVYYLLAQPATETTTTSPTDAQQVNLIKLGDEIFGPKDRMEINRDAIKYMEDMKDDSQINQKIADFINNKK